MELCSLRNVNDQNHLFLGLISGLLDHVVPDAQGVALTHGMGVPWGLLRGIVSGSTQTRASEPAPLVTCMHVNPGDALFKVNLHFALGN